MTTSRKTLLAGLTAAGVGAVAAKAAPVAAQGAEPGATLLALYKQPSDPAKFDAYYRDHHGPLAKTLPGLQTYTISGPLTDPKSAYYMVAELTFASMATLQSALGSDIGKKVVADLPNFAAAGVDILSYPNKAIA